MRPLLQKFAISRRRFAAARGGNVAVIFGLSLIPLVGMAGAAIDYTRAAQLRAHFNSAADSAALSAIMGRLRNNGTPLSDAQVAGFFYGASGADTQEIMPAVTVSNATDGLGASVTVSYTASVPTSFVSLLGIPAITIGGSAVSAVTLPKYAVFNFLLDNSPSMGIGASAADISLLQSLTPDSCAFACHQHTFDAQGRITGNSTNDYYTIAKNSGVKTRIDVLRDSVKSIAQLASQLQQAPGQFKMAVYSFSETFQTITAPIANLVSGPTSVTGLAGNIDLAFAYYDQRDTQTSFDTALTDINSALPAAGDGSSSGSPLQYLFFVTDGMQDAPVGAASGAGDPADTIAPDSAYVPPAVATQMNRSNTMTGNAQPTRLIAALDPALCNPIKARNIKVAVLYTPYLPIVNNAYYNQWAAPVAPQIPLNLRACASPDLYFEVAPGQAINDAMMTMFNSIVSKVRLTK